jgi:hypothetical protein
MLSAIGLTGPQVCLLLSVTAIVSRKACKQMKFVIGLANSSPLGQNNMDTGKERKNVMNL